MVLEDFEGGKSSSSRNDLVGEFGLMRFVLLVDLLVLILSVV
jgi:hypothetical protein